MHFKTIIGVITVYKLIVCLFFACHHCFACLAFEACIAPPYQKASYTGQLL